MTENKKTLEKVEEIKELLSNKPQHKFLCGTEKIKYYCFLGEDCLKKYEEIPNEDKTDTLLDYLKETLSKLQREEFGYNQQSALNLCQTILERNRERQIASH
jgi:hypothetical protein